MWEFKSRQSTRKSFPSSAAAFLYHSPVALIFIRPENIPLHSRKLPRNSTTKYTQCVDKVNFIWDDIFVRGGNRDSSQPLRSLFKKHFSQAITVKLICLCLSQKQANFFFIKPWLEKMFQLEWLLNQPSALRSWRRIECHSRIIYLSLQLEAKTSLNWQNVQLGMFSLIA